MITHLSKRFTNDPTYAAYLEFLNEYERLGHMKLVSDSQAEPKFLYYLPYHGVIRKTSSTSKLRVFLMDQVVPLLEFPSMISFILELNCKSMYSIS